MNNLNLVFSKNSIEKAKQEFIKQCKPTFKVPGKQEFVHFKLDEGFFRDAVWQGYQDACRTMRGISSANKGLGAFAELSRELLGYFNSADVEFSHNAWCKHFVDNLEKDNEGSEKPFIPRYGQAQKVVNMAFKYLYCCKGTDEIRGKFEPCHMPLDRYTLLWYFSEKGTLYKNWSYLEEPQYTDIQNNIKGIRDKLREEFGDVTVLDIELVAWNELQRKVVSLKK